MTEKEEVVEEPRITKDGQVRIVINGETKWLKPSLRAAQNLSRFGGGYSNLVQRVSFIDMDAIAAVIKEGLQLTDHGAKGLEERIYSTGLATLATPCILFIHTLARGGKPPEDEGAETVTDEKN